MKKELAVKILKDMLGDYKDNILSKDKEALEYAIKELGRTAREVLAQEQLSEISTGSKTINQIRKQNGLEPIEDGDVLYHKVIV